MRPKVTLITGASGEIGHALVRHLAAHGQTQLLTFDLNPLPADIEKLVFRHVQGSILDASLLDRLVGLYEIEAIYHLAAMLSTQSEIKTGLAHKVNVDGTLMLLELAADQSQWRGEPVQFIFPSSIAVYGMPDLVTKGAHPEVLEDDWNKPTTMYGCNKLYCEQVGRYFAHHYRQLSAEKPVMLDFRSVRFPGLISAYTLPTGGTSDYGPEMIHAAAQGKEYPCFVREDSIIPFMTMGDGVKALLSLAAAKREDLTRTVYNVTSFSLTAGEIADRVRGFFPKAEISTAVHQKRQGIVDSWPAGLNDQQARKDWGWAPEFDAEQAFSEYLIPNIRKRYEK